MSSLNTAAIIADMGSLLTVVQKNIMENTGFDFETFVGFGLQTSHVYRAKLLGIFAAQSISDKAQNYIFFYVMLIKNRDRILKMLKSAEFQAKFSGDADFKQAIEFFELNTVQYVTEVDSSPGNKGKMPVVNIPTCVPNIMSHLWLSYNKENPQWNNFSREAKYNLWVDQQWAGQMNVSVEVKQNAKVQNEAFWTSKVTSSKNNSRKTAVALKFHPEYWKNQEADMYPFIRIGADGSMSYDPTLYSKETVMDYLS